MLTLFLWLIGAGYVALGLAYLVAPVQLAATTGMALPAVGAVIDVQAFYGGQMLGVGVAALLALRQSWLQMPVLVMIAATLGGTAFGRAAGMVSAGEAPLLMVGLFVLEAVVTATALALLSRTRATP